MIKGFWTCPNCETQNPFALKKCEVCDLVRPDYLSPPEIVKFVSNNEKQVKCGHLVHLIWETKNSSFCFINGVKVKSSGEKDFIVENKFVLKVTNNVGFEEKVLNFAVIPNPKIVEFSISKQNIIYNKSTIVRWRTEDIKEVLLNDSHKYAPNDIITLSPLINTTYSLCFCGINGEKITKSFSIGVTIPGPNIHIHRPASAFPYGAVADLAWYSDYVKYVEFRGKHYAPSDHIQLNLIENIHDELVFYGENGKTYRRPLDVEVYNPIKILNCSKTLTLRTGEVGTIKWDAQNVDYVLVDSGAKKYGACGQYNIKALNNSKPSNRMYSIHFVNKYQVEDRTVEVVSLPQPPKIKSVISGEKHNREGENQSGCAKWIISCVLVMYLIFLIIWIIVQMR